MQIFNRTEGQWRWILSALANRAYSMDLINQNQEEAPLSLYTTWSGKVFSFLMTILLPLEALEQAAVELASIAFIYPFITVLFGRWISRTFEDWFNVHWSKWLSERGCIVCHNIAWALHSKEMLVIFP